MGPDNRIRRYDSCMVNGYRFHTIAHEKGRRTQNNGVVVKGDLGNSIIDIYGVVNDIIEVDYLLAMKHGSDTAIRV
ncbi:hypothetical protein AXF42_Ash005839 [Apostasia shenzhenica]|uniref:Uncharacterized protein n=1 Tax=Apostasia shenzhenica TaxID=1088818 RepID=A0A2I0BCJ4_9ASPA|nr:hypothetical protein AXF42_Ash005839 [Apostasia shenzhenica]